MSDITFKEVIQKTNKIIETFQKFEPRKWGAEGNIIELNKQIGELSKNVMMLEKYYGPGRENNPYYNKASKEEIGNELSDIFFILVRIANHYGVDFEQAHLNELEIAQEYFDGKRT